MEAFSGGITFRSLDKVDSLVFKVFLAKEEIFVVLVSLDEDIALAFDGFILAFWQSCREFAKVRCWV